MARYCIPDNPGCPSCLKTRELLVPLLEALEPFQHAWTAGLSAGKDDEAPIIHFTSFFGAHAWLTLEELRRVLYAASQFHELRQSPAERSLRDLTDAEQGALAAAIGEALRWADARAGQKDGATA